ncbi:UNVERIFIED_CONTAM: hypothetical protein GTU68_048285, partial [Idotea baltica]|nr:hypothetical protein [Idotea baltica]
MIRVGIVGGAGYTAGELIRLLIWHPHAQITSVQSSSQQGRSVSDVHRDLIGEFDGCFVKELDTEVDVIFICAGHGRSRSWLSDQVFSSHVKIIDLSSDFRLIDAADGFIYGLPELNRSRICAHNKIANPGCFATAIQLALLPLAQKHLLKSEVHVHALTGSTGAGQEPTPTTHFSWRNNNVSIYKPFVHQHLDEIKQSLVQCQPNFDQVINFLPIRGNFTRGIFASLYLSLDIDFDDVQELFVNYYQSHP